MRRLLLFIPAAVFVGLAALLYRGLSLDPTDLPSALIDRSLPEFRLRALGTEEYLERDDIVGRASLLNVWGTWCPTCVAEHPYLMKLAEEGVPIIGLNYKDEDSKALSWLARQVALGAGAFHGRLYFNNRDSMGESTGHGSPLPHMVHGGPGRAGGGEELGDIRRV